MIGRLVVAVAIGIIAFLVCLAIAIVLDALKISVLADLGSFLKQWAIVIGIVVGVLAFFSGYNPLNRPGL